MSGHSKWSQIRHKKGLADQKKGQVFSKLSKLISIAARKGADPEKNSELKNTVEQARSFNMPKESIERAIKRVSDKSQVQLEELTIEAMGPESIALIITAITDNKNRTIAEIKKILNERQYKITAPGSAMWLFDPAKSRDGSAVLRDHGAGPVKSQSDHGAGQKGFVPKYPLENVGQETRQGLEKTLGALNEQEDVQEVYDNIKPLT